jgi:hypothetical protein
MEGGMIAPYPVITITPSLYSTTTTAIGTIYSGNTTLTITNGTYIIPSTIWPDGLTVTFNANSASATSSTIKP